MRKTNKGNWDEWFVADTSNKKNSFVNQAIAQRHDFYISGDVEPAENYIDWFNTIRNAGADDVVTLYINSYGGDMYCALQFLSVLQESQATTIARVEGACMSAATMIALGCEAFTVSPESVWMVHNYSGGTLGKGGEMHDQISFERKWSSKFITETYKHFLTEEEIKCVLDGKDMWMDADEAIERLIKRADAINAEIDAEIEAEMELEEEPKPKKKASKKKVSKKKASKKGEK